MIIRAVTAVNYVLDPKAPLTQKEDILVQQQSAPSPNAQNFIILFATFLRTLRGLLQVLMKMCFGLYYTMSCGCKIDIQSGSVAMNMQHNAYMLNIYLVYLLLHTSPEGK